VSMEAQNKPPIVNGGSERQVQAASAGPSDLMKSLLPLSGSEVINRVINLENAEEAVRALPHMDLYWLVKKVGEYDAWPLLKLASDEQWQFMLDLETWVRDRVDIDQATNWLGRLFQADPERVLKWLLGEGELFTYWYFSNKIEVRIKERDEVLEDTTFVTLDDIVYYRLPNAEEGDFIQEVLRRLAEEDYLRYQSIMMGLAGTLRDAVEEEMYRLRNVRIAEDGFLPHEQAVSLYAYLGSDALKPEKLPSPQVDPTNDRLPIPVAPILQVGENCLFLRALQQDPDPVLLERVRLEFAGLCNQIISADRIRVGDAEDLVRVCRKAAGYINAGLEKLSGGKFERGQSYLRENPLQEVFRVGFSLALEVKWEAERWLKDAWFVRRDLRPAFWGDWGGILVGILQKRPLLYKGASSQPPYADFEGSADIQMCRETLRQMKALDNLLDRVSSKYPVERQWVKDPLFTFHALIFNFWARQKLEIEPGFAPLSLQEVTNFFRLIRAGSDRPPFGMKAFKKIFVEDMTAHGRDFDPETTKELRQALSMVWDKFREEYAWVATADLDGRYMKFILTSPSPEVAPR
jgi:hypothetical protein